MDTVASSSAGTHATASSGDTAVHSQQYEQAASPAAAGTSTTSHSSLLQGIDHSGIDSPPVGTPGGAATPQNQNRLPLEQANAKLLADGGVPRSSTASTGGSVPGSPLVAGTPAGTAHKGEKEKEKPHHKGGLLGTLGGLGRHDSVKDKDKKHKEKDGDLARTGSGCSDVAEHFKAIKLGLGKKNTAAHNDEHGRASHTAAAASGRPGLHHTITEQDERALKVDRAAQLKEEQLAREAAYRDAYANDPLNANYGFLNIDATPNPIDTSGKKDTFREIAEKKEGEHVFFRARIQSTRHQSAKLAFVIFRQRYDEIQGVLALESEHVSENFVRFVERLPNETIVLCSGVVQDPHSVGQSDIHYTSIHNVEIRIRTLHVVSQVTTAPPFNIHDAARPQADFESDQTHHGIQVSARQHFSNRVASLRTPTNQAIFQLRAAMVNYFRTHLSSQGFTEIQSSKFQAGATESGASVFKVDYFKRPVSLAQSPQLAKQMCIAADMERVFEIGPVFRAENSQTARHLTEFIGMDLEMAIDNDYHEVIDMLDGMFIKLFQGIQANQRHLLEVVRRQFPSEDLVVPDKTVRLTFKEAVDLINESGFTEDGEKLSEYEDFSTPAEKHLGKLVKEKYHTDYYIVDKFPASVRPFYTMPDPDNPKLSNSADFFIRGQEVLSGGQRIHHAPMLEKRMIEAKIDPKEMVDYLDGFRWGCPPHGGGGIGLERVLFLYLDLQNVRWASLLPRDPKSFPEDTRPHGGKAIRGPEVDLLEWDTQRRRGENAPMPSVEDLIASYGDAANTVLLDPSWEVWRDEQTGAATGFKQSEGYALCWGRPLCDDSQLKEVLEHFLHYIKKERKLKPLMICIDETTEQLLAKQHDWRSLAVAAEERIDPTAHNPNSQASKSNLAKKIKQAKNAGVKAVVCEEVPSKAIQDKIDAGLHDWKNSREGKQMHTTEHLLWLDSKHRKYFYAEDKSGKIVAVVVLAQLAPVHGWQIKFSISFPDGPSGAIELLLSTAITTLAGAGCTSATFGTSAATHLEKGSHQSAVKMKALSKAYDAITSSFHLLNKSDFRSKFSSEQDPVWIAYPKHGGLGVQGIHAIVSGLSD